MTRRELPIPLEQTFDGLIGLELLEPGGDEVRGRLELRDDLLQPLGLLHGGVLAAIAESLASAATYMAVAGEGRVAMGMSNSTSFMRPITEGSVEAVARPRHRGRTTWLWDVDMTDDAGRLCATSRVTIAVREAPEAPHAREAPEAQPR